MTNDAHDKIATYSMRDMMGTSISATFWRHKQYDESHEREWMQRWRAVDWYPGFTARPYCSTRDACLSIVVWQLVVHPQPG